MEDKFSSNKPISKTMSFDGIIPHTRTLGLEKHVSSVFM
jgi:hypothetical protein